MAEILMNKNILPKTILNSKMNRIIMRGMVMMMKAIIKVAIILKAVGVMRRTSLE